MKYALAGLGILLAFAAGACSQKNYAATGNCNGSGLIDSNQRVYLCLEDKANPRIMNGYSADQVIKLVLEREDNAWSQLMAISDTSSRLDRLTARGLRAREEYGKSPRVADINQVLSMKTQDTGNTVITMKTTDGVTSSLWMEPGDLDHGLKVRSVTPY